MSLRCCRDVIAISARGVRDTARLPRHLGPMTTAVDQEKDDEDAGLPGLPALHRLLFASRHLAVRVRGDPKHHLVCGNPLRVTGVTPPVTCVTNDVIFGDRFVTRRHGCCHVPRRARMARPL